jgi:hypothetical protein
MARVANRIPRCRRAQLLADEPTMGIVTIGTLNKSFFHTMVEGHIELRLDLLMAGVAQGRLRFDKEVLVLHSVVSRMTTQAAQVVIAVRRPGKIHVIFAGGVALQTALIDFFCRCSFKAENILGIAGVVDMGDGCAVAGFASLLGWTATLIERGFPVRGFVKVVVDILVTGLASFGANILRGRFPRYGLLLSVGET